MALNEPDGPDNTTAALILNLQSLEIEELPNYGKGKGREGQASDADLAPAESLQKPSTEVLRQCTFCLSEKSLSNVVQLPCGRDQCKECLIEFFTLATRDQAPWQRRHFDDQHHEWRIPLDAVLTIMDEYRYGNP